MKSKVQFLVLTLTILTVFQLRAQTNSKNELKDFKIIIDNTDDVISMKSLNGSAWLDLSFSKKKYKPQDVDEYGMTELEKVSERKDTDLADFLFTITKTNEGLELKGIEGTAWKELSFTLQEGSKQAIDQFGMTNQN